MKKCIITPTFIGHFKYIKNYLKSFDKYLIDRDFPIYFIINSNENIEFQKLVEPYKNKLNINVVFLDEIFKKYNIVETPEEALKKYGRLSFQTLKKLYGALFINYDQFLLLDSESMLIKDTDMNQMFEDYFKKPKFFVSRISDKPDSYKYGFTYEFIDAVVSLWGGVPKYYTTETYEWFYELRILKDIVDDLGNIINIVKDYKLKNKFPNVEGILEALLYYQYILQNNKKYNYSVYVVEDELKKFFGIEKYNNFYNNFYNSNFKLSGVLECIFMFVDSNNYKELTNFINYYKIGIMRVENTINIKNLLYQKYIINNTNIKICPSAQNHSFGINNNFIINLQLVCKIYKDIKKFKKHLVLLINPIKSFLNWFSQIFSVIFYSVKIIIKLTLNFWKLFI